MARQVIMTDRVAKPKVPLSNAVKVGNLIFVSGTTPYTTDHKIAVGDFKAQMRQTLENIKEGTGDVVD